MAKSTVTPSAVSRTNGGIGNTVYDGFCAVAGIGRRSKVMPRLVRKSVTWDNGNGVPGSVRSA